MTSDFLWCWISWCCIDRWVCHNRCGAAVRHYRLLAIFTRDRNSSNMKSPETSPFDELVCLVRIFLFNSRKSTKNFRNKCSCETASLSVNCLSAGDNLIPVPIERPLHSSYHRVYHKHTLNFVESKLFPLFKISSCRTDRADSFMRRSIGVTLTIWLIWYLHDLNFQLIASVSSFTIWNGWIRCRVCLRRCPQSSINNSNSSTHTKTTFPNSEKKNQWINPMNVHQIDQKLISVYAIIIAFFIFFVCLFVCRSLHIIESIIELEIMAFLLFHKKPNYPLYI